MGNPFSHTTRTFQIRLSHGIITVAGNRLHRNLSNVSYGK